MVIEIEKQSKIKNLMVEKIMEAIDRIDRDYDINMEEIRNTLYTYTIQELYEELDEINDVIEYLNYVNKLKKN